MWGNPWEFESPLPHGDDTGVGHRASTVEAKPALQITSEPVEPRQVRLTIVVPEDRVSRAVHATAQVIGRRIKLRGYRPGKIPVAAVARQVGADALKSEATDALVREAAEAAIRSEGLEAAAPASVEVTAAEPLTLSVLVPLAPAIKLGDYRQRLRVPPPEPEAVTDDDVDEVLASLQGDLAYLEPVDRPSREGDAVALSLTGRFLDDTIVFEDEGITVRLDDEGLKKALLPVEVKDHVVGRAAGDLFEFTVSYPEDWRQKEMRGRAVTFGAKVLSVSELAVPGLDDDFATQVSDADTLEELRGRIRSGLEARRARAARERHAEDALAALVGLAEVSFPPALVDMEVARLVADLRDRVERQGLKWERWLELQDKSEDDLWREMEAEARERLARRLVLGVFVASEGIDVSTQETEDAVRRLRASVAPAERKKLPRAQELRSRTRSRLLADRAMERLLAIAVGEAPDLEKTLAGEATGPDDRGLARTPADSTSEEDRAPAGVPTPQGAPEE